MHSVQTQQGNKAPFLPFLSKLQHKQIHQGNSNYCYLTQGKDLSPCFTRSCQEAALSAHK